MDITYAVESAHDANVMQHVYPQCKKSNLSSMMKMLTLEPHFAVENCDCTEEMLRMRRQLRILKADVDALDRNDKFFYQKQEVLIYKIFCEVQGLYACDLPECVEETEQDLQEYVEETEQDLQEYVEETE